MVRWLRIVSMTIAVIGVLAALIGLWMSPRPGTAGLGTRMITFGMAAILIGIVISLVPALDRLWRWLAGKPMKRRLHHEARPYVCPSCGYQLHGATGVFCPECGTVRPMPIDGERK